MTTQRWWAIPALSIAGMISVACGGTEDPVDKGPNYKYPDVSSFCEAKARAECTPSVLNRCQTTKDECVIARRGKSCAQEAPAGASYRPTEAEACIEAVSAAYQDDEYTAEEKAAEAEACALLWGGGGDVGAMCVANHQCDLDKDLRCVKRTNQAQGQCFVPDEKQPGQPCEAAQSVCAEGNFCTDSEPHVCANKRAEGTACGPTLPCNDGLRCVGEEGSQACASKSTVGTQCEQDSECVSDMCSPIGAVKKCVSSVILAPNEPVCAEFQ